MQVMRRDHAGAQYAAILAAVEAFKLAGWDSTWFLLCELKDDLAWASPRYCRSINRNVEHPVAPLDP
jgi:hypothetical protein